LQALPFQWASSILTGIETCSITEIRAKQVEYSNRGTLAQTALRNADVRNPVG